MVRSMTPKYRAPDTREARPKGRASARSLLVATLVTRLAQELAVLLLRHALAALLDNGTHRISSLYSYPAEPFDSVATRGYLYRYNRSKTHFRHRNTPAF